MSDDIHAERRIHQLEEQLRNARDDALEEVVALVDHWVTGMAVMPVKDSFSWEEINVLKNKFFGFFANDIHRMKSGATAQQLIKEWNTP